MIRKIARPMLASVYIADGADTLLNTSAHIRATENVLDKVRSLLPEDLARNVPNDPELVTRAVGGTKIGAGALLALGKAPRLSAGTLALLSVPTILGRYNFWDADTDEEKSTRRSGFLTHVALLGGLAITSVDTAGKPSVAWRAKKAGQEVSEKVQSALPGKDESQKTVEQAGSWVSEKADQAQEAVSSYVDDHKGEWKKTADQAADTASEWWGTAVDSGKQLIDTVQSEAPKWAGQAERTGRELLAEAQQSGKKLNKRAVKLADQAQGRADQAFSRAEQATGRAAKRASHKAEKFQREADKAVDRAVKKVKKQLK
ncbi:MAG TPA: DoxX family membrane protein [Corynebacterium sp.]|nr:DoxX family membrane protein [Corynebacterium sp.]